MTAKRPAKKPKSKAPKTPKGAKADKPTRRQIRENGAGIGHNVAALRDEGLPYVTRFLKLKASQADDNAHYRADYNNLYEEGAGVLGISQEVLKAELNRIFKNQKAAQKEAEMEAEEREQTERWRAAMEGTQYEMFAAGALAEGAADAPEAEQSEEDEAEEAGAD